MVCLIIEILFMERLFQSVRHQKFHVVGVKLLDRSRNYMAEIYRDADVADWKTNPAAYTIEQRKVDANSPLELRLAPGGGEAIRFRALEN